MHKRQAIHCDICPTLLKTDPEQQLDAGWDNIDNQACRTILLIQPADTHGLLALMVQAISSSGANIESVDTPSRTQDGTEDFVEFRFIVKTADLEQLNCVIHSLHTISQIRKVIRN